MVVNIRHNKTAISECVDHISGLFVNLYFVEGLGFSGESNSVRISRKFPNPPEFYLKFVYDWGIVFRLSRLRCVGDHSHQVFQPSEGAGVSISAYPYRFEISWYIEDSFVPMNVAHDLDRADNDTIVVKGSH